MNIKMQEIYINLDDSGKLTSNELISVYGGIVFTSKKEKDKFITQYKSIINNIKCNYCKHSENCDKSCPEIKNTNIKASDKRRIMNYLKKYYIIGLIIQNDKIYSYIMSNKAARGRFTDYALRRLIKETICEFINSNKINPHNPIRLIINIDEQSTKSNGYYNLHDGLLEELKYGITNYNYETKIKPIIYSKLEIIITYQDSRKSYVVQAADLLAGTIRRKTLESIENNKKIKNEICKTVDFSIILP